MANKLYEETAVADIADAIRQINGKTKFYTVAEMGNAIREIKRKVYRGTVTETVVGQGVYAVLAKDSFLAEHREDETLFIRIQFDVEPQAYTIAETWCVGENKKGFLPSNAYQCCKRYTSVTEISYSSPGVPVNSENSHGVGCVLIMDDGELRIYSNSSSNYAIRKAAYTVIVEC